MAVGLATVRYVKALFSAAEKSGQRDAVGKALSTLGDLVDETPELRAALSNPRLPVAVKKKLLAAAGLSGEGGAPQLVQDFCHLALERRRPEVVLEAAEEFARLDREAKGVVVAFIETARPLDDATRKSLKAKLEEVTAKSVEIEEEIVPELLGGVRIRIGSRMWDGSVRRRLDDLVTQLAK